MARDQSAAGTKIHDQLLRSPLSSASGDTVVIVEEEEDEEERRAEEELKLNEEWVKKMRGWLMVLATLAASVTYSAGLNPPGGFWQQDDLKPSTNSNIQPHTTGNPVLASIFQTEVRLALLKGCVVANMFTLMMAFGADSTRHPADIAGVVASSLWTFSYLIFRVWRIKKKPPARRSSSSQERDVELGAIGQQTYQDR
ncbi:hypothetical protein COCNU_01G013720 [Cocos nucifera]|uniref:PGG domain-containing protein n=1 Tax=Cocos nucifera TaxID=13894 RepID=A0A8K0HWF2_COCNU|nr:hypothetical protein COCNU_01G013720 [Cocos nucifera]